MVYSAFHHFKHPTPSTLSAIDAHVVPRVSIYELDGHCLSILTDAKDWLDVLLFVP